MKHPINYLSVSRTATVLSVAAILAVGCSGPQQPATPAPSSTETTNSAQTQPAQTKNMSPDDTVKAHMKQAQESGGGR